MAVNDFVGLRKLTMARLLTPASGQTPAVYETNTIIGNKVSSDGLDLQATPIEATLESFAGTETMPVGTECKKSTANLLPYNVEDMHHMLPGGFDPVQGTWNMFTDDCNLKDITLAFERVCPGADGKHGPNVLLRHCNLTLTHNANFKRAAQFVLQIGLYPTLQPGSEYGLTGANATKLMPWQYYNGIYDGTTDTVTYDPVD